MLVGARAARQERSDKSVTYYMRPKELAAKKLSR